MEWRNTLLSKISEINSELITRNDLAFIETLLFGDNSFSQFDNSRILDATIAFVVTSKRFDTPLLVRSICEKLGSRHQQKQVYIFSIVPVLPK